MQSGKLVVLCHLKGVVLRDTGVTGLHISSKTSSGLAETNPEQLSFSPNPENVLEELQSGSPDPSEKNASKELEYPLSTISFRIH